MQMSDKENNIEALLMQAKVMSNVLDNIGSYVYSKDLAGKYTYVNADVAELFQRSVQDIIGKDDSHFFDLDISNEISENDLKVIRNKAPVISEENNVIKSTGKVKTYKIIKKPILDSSANVIGISGISIDITEKKALEAKNKEQKYLLDVILDNVDAYIYMKDENRYFRYVNNRVAKLFGYPAKEIVGKRDIDVISQADADHFWETDKLAFDSNDKVIINEKIKAADNKVHHYLSIKVPCHFEDDCKTLIGFSTDVTELYQLKEKFEQLANIDELTSLYNRRYFFDNANREFNRAKRHQQALAVISIDVDRFKKINDTYGHPAGDKVLMEIAKLINPTIRSEDIFARIGGEEFSILLPNTSRFESKKAAERLRHLLDNNPISITDDISLSIKISLGVSVLKATDDSFQDLYARSDIALYKAKSMGRNNVYLID